MGQAPAGADIHLAGVGVVLAVLDSRRVAVQLDVIGMDCDLAPGPAALGAQSGDAGEDRGQF